MTTGVRVARGGPVTLPSVQRARLSSRLACASVRPTSAGTTHLPAGAPGRSRVFPRPMLFGTTSVNQIVPPGPAAIPPGRFSCVGSRNSLTVPLGVIRAISLVRNWVNHRSPPGPTVISRGPLPGSGISNLLILPLGVIRPILLDALSVNQALPSGPAVIPQGRLDAIRNSLISPAGVTRPILPTSARWTRRRLRGQP